MTKTGWKRIPKKQRIFYKKRLKLEAKQSKISANKIPILDWKIAEDIYCDSFETENIGTHNHAIDTKHKRNGVGTCGIGIKTFVDYSSRQKIAEFNKDKKDIDSIINTKDKIKKISKLRNERIKLAKRQYNCDCMLYHTIRRTCDKFIIVECKMELINENTILNLKKTNSSIFWNDGTTNYSFNFSKSTLYKVFNKHKIVSSISINIDEVTPDIFNDDKIKLLETEIKYTKEKTKYPHIILPLYSKNKIVYEKSGLNQWNVKGRDRNINEIYIPIPCKIHKKYPEFFPNKDEEFTLILPNGNILSTKVCQENNKALMSNPNKALGEWLLRDILQLKEKELLTYNKLHELGIDSVIIYKIDKHKFTIDFKEEGSYKTFENL